MSEERVQINGEWYTLRLRNGQPASHVDHRVARLAGHRQDDGREQT